MNPVQLALNIGDEFKLKSENGGIQNTAGYRSLGEFISAILPNIYVVASLILFVLIIGAGFVIIASGNDPQKKGQGAKAFTSAIIGFIIIFVSFWIIKLIEFFTGIEIFNPFPSS